MTAEVAEGYEVIEYKINTAEHIFGDIWECLQSHLVGVEWGR